jgi:hypothetical protein
MQTTTNPLSYRIIRARRFPVATWTGWPAVSFVFEIHARYSVDKPPVALTRTDGTPRTFKTRQAARAAIRRLRAAE